MTEMVEVLLAYLSENWTRNNSIFIPKTFSRHWNDPEDALPAITVILKPSPRIRHHHLSGNVLEIWKDYKITLRSHNPNHMEEFEQETLRILMQDLKDLSTNNYPNETIRTLMIEAINPSTEDRSYGDYIYRRDIDISILKTPVY